MKKFKTIPYYTPQRKLAKQIKASSEKRKTSSLSFIIKKLRNYILQSLAYNCPINGFRIKFHRWRGVKIGKGVMLGMHCVLDNAFPEYIVLEDYTALAGNNYLVAHTNPYLHQKGRLLSYLAPVVVKKGAWVGVSSTLLPGCEIGECSIVSAGSTVSGKTASNVIVAGNPAQVIKRFPEDEEIFSCYE